jgi:hypothetical protein
VLCAKLRFHIPGVLTIPELIAGNKPPYYDALESADKADASGSLDVSEMERILRDALAHQLVAASNKTSSPDESSPSVAPSARRGPRMEPPTRIDAEKALAVGFGGSCVLILVGLIVANVLGAQMSPNTLRLVTLLFALCGGLALGFVRGHAEARGTVKLPASLGQVRFNATGGAGFMVILLILSWAILLRG